MVGVGFLVMVGWAVAMGAHAVEPFDQIVPITTTGFVSVTDVDVLEAQWQKTQISALLRDPVMKPFLDDLQGQFKERLSRLRSRIGVSVDELRGVPTGEFAVAAVQPAKGEGALALLADVTGNVPQAQELLQKVSDSLTRDGAKRTERTVGQTTVILFDLPKPADRPNARERQAVYFLAQDRGLLAASDNIQLIQQLLTNLYGQKGKTLSESPAYQAVNAAVAKQAGDAPSHVRWFIAPIEYGEVLQALAPEPDPTDRHRKPKKTPLDILRNQGFEAVQGVGGSVEVAEGKFEYHHRSAIVAPPPYKNSMQMLKFPNSSDFVPQSWVPRDVATYATFRIDVLNAFDNFGPLFDELFGEGETGIWKEVLQSLREDPNGPQIDLREELIRHLGPRVTVITSYELPITPTSERILAAVEAQDPAAVAAALEKSLKNDPAARRREVNGQVIWEIVEDQESDLPQMEVEVPQLTPFRDRVRPKAEEEEEEPEEERPPLEILQHAAVTVVHGQLMICSNLDYLTRILTLPAERETLARTIDYRLVDGQLNQMAPGECIARTFSRTEEEYRPAYELIRQGRMPQAETVLGRVLNRILGEQKRGAVRQQKIEGDKLPDFQVVRRYLRPAGIYVSAIENGWYIEGFMFGGSEEKPEAAQPAPTEPAPTEPAPTEPAPTEPAPTEPAPTEPAPTEPAPTEPATTQSAAPAAEPAPAP